MTNNITLTNITDLDRIIFDYVSDLEFCDKYQRVLDEYNEKMLSTITDINEIYTDMRDDGIFNQDLTITNPIKLDCVCIHCQSYLINKIKNRI